MASDRQSVGVKDKKMDNHQSSMDIVIGVDMVSVERFAKLLQKFDMTFTIPSPK